jgi:hypothetical protein
MPVNHTSGVNIKIYGDGSSPGTLLGQKSFLPQYQSYTNENSFREKDKTMDVPTETFVAFDRPIDVNQKFFVAYTISKSEGNQFCVYNTQFAQQGKSNTAWVMANGQWIKVTELENITPTSLALQPLIRYTNGSSIHETHRDAGENLHYNRFAGQLSLDSGTKSDGRVLVYTVNGQLIEQIPFSKGEKLFKLAFRPKGSVGIVKIIQENKVISKKILY